jgi:hypothetical protein
MRPEMRVRTPPDSPEISPVAHARWPALRGRRAAIKRIDTYDLFMHYITT